MRVNGTMWWILAGYFIVVGATYVVWSLAASGAIEPAGTVGLGLAAIASTLIAFYLTRVRRSQGGVLPEDRPEANIDDGDPEIGQFSPWSWWPVTLAFAAGLLLLGLAIGPWVSMLGAPILIVALVGWVYEYYRGYFAR